MTPNFTYDDACEELKTLTDGAYFEVLLPAGTHLTIIRLNRLSYIVQTKFEEKIEMVKHKFIIQVQKEIEKAYSLDFIKFNSKK